MLPSAYSLRPKRDLREIMYAETRTEAKHSIDRFLAEFAPKCDNAAGCLAKDRAALQTHFDFPAE